MRTYQEIFTTVYNHLIKQGERAVDMNDTCVYRANNGLKCAIGCLITDDAYDPKIEGVGVDAEEVITAIRKSHISTSKKSLEFLEVLQEAHDFSLKRGIDDFNDAMHDIAKHYNLEML